MKDIDKITAIERVRTQRANEELLTAILLDTLRDVTQEINVALCHMKAENINLNKTVPRVKKIIGNDRLYNLKELCRFHGKNLQMIAMFLERYTNEPAPAHKIELFEARQAMAGEYVHEHDSIYDRHFNSACETLRQYEGG